MSKEHKEIDLTRLQGSLDGLIFFLSFLLCKYFSVFDFIDYKYTIIPCCFPFSRGGYTSCKENTSVILLKAVA